ncbi:MAG: hypothetical protein WEB88_01085, partial [Gemmatimonadota bacterium]
MKLVRVMPTVAAALVALPLYAQAPGTLPAEVIEALEWRPIGPANMTGRVTDVEGIPSPSKTFYVATAAGGIWKTTNNGVTFRPLFTNEKVIAMGDLAIAPSNPEIIWAGTGEEDTRNSISQAGGIYKSTDGGLNWTLMGLEQTGTIGRIVVHPTNPDIVYVAASGAIWNHNPERGLYKTTNGGRSWELVKFISDRAGFIDVVMDPRNPDVLFAASWERVRGPYFLKSGGPGSALWKTTDAGRTWTAVTGGGFPATEKGRIGLAMALSNPDVIYALVEAQDPEDPNGEGCRAAKPGGCGLYRSADGGRTWEWKAPNNVRPFYYSQVRVDPADENRVYWSSTPVNWSPDGGASVGNTTQGLHVDHHAMWIDPRDPERVIVGNDGGIGISFDRGGNWLFPNTINVGQFYDVSFNMDVPYRVCGGLQDNGTWCGPSRASGGIHNFHWYNVGGGDGFVSAQDPRDHDLIYVESQGGSMSWRNLRTGERGGISKPQGTRWNWNTPFFISAHDPDVFYAAGNVVIKMSDRDEVVAISEDLSKQDERKIEISRRETGGVTRDATGAETYGTITALAESPLRRGWLYAGTDDGNVWMTQDEGGSWTELTDRFPGVPDSTYVSRIAPSNHDANRFYVSFDNHRTGDFTPYVFVTTDGGRSFRSIAGGLPHGGIDYVHVVKEDLINPDLLFVGTDVGVYVSIDRGQNWQRFMTGLPTVPVHDLEIHPRERELIAGTHGRSIWIADIAPLQQFRPAVVAQATLFEPAPATRYSEFPVGGGNPGHAFFRATAPGSDAMIRYWLPASAGEMLDLAILDARGDTVQTLRGPGGQGLQAVTWNLRSRPEPPPPLTPREREDSIANATRIATVADSLKAAGMEAASVDRLAGLISGEETFGGGGPGGGPGGG